MVGTRGTSIQLWYKDWGGGGLNGEQRERSLKLGGWRNWGGGKRAGAVGGSYGVEKKKEKKTETTVLSSHLTYPGQWPYT